MTRWMMIASALSLATTAPLAQEFGLREEQDYAARLWRNMQERDLAGAGALQAFPYPGTDPHGMMLSTFYTVANTNSL